MKTFIKYTIVFVVGMALIYVILKGMPAPALEEFIEIWQLLN